MDQKFLVSEVEQGVKLLTEKYKIDTQRLKHLQMSCLKDEFLAHEQLFESIKLLDFTITSLSINDEVVLNESGSYLLIDHENHIVTINGSDITKGQMENSAEAYFLDFEEAQTPPKITYETVTFKWIMKELFSKEGYYLIIAGFITNLLLFVVPLYKMNVFDKVLPNGFSGMLNWLLVVAMILTVVWFLNRAAMSFILGNKLKDIGRDLQRGFAERLCYLQVSKIPLSTSFLTELISGGQSIVRMIGLLNVIAIIDLPFTVLFLFMIWFIGGNLVVIPLIAIAIVLAINIAIQPTIKNYVNKTLEKAALKKKVEYEIMQSISYIKMASMENYFSKMRKIARPKDYPKYETWNSIVSQLSTLIVFFSLIIMVYVGVIQIINGTLTIGQLIACSIFTAKAVSTAKISGLFFNLYKIKRLFKNLTKFYAIPLECKDNPIKVASIAEMRLKDVTYQHPKNAYFELKHLNLTLNSTSMIYVYGAPGAGKTTLFHLVSGLKEPVTGQLLINSLDSNNFDFTELRKHLHLNSSGFRFFSGTIMDNLTSDRNYISSEEVTAALEKVKMVEKVNQLEGGLSYYIENIQKVPFSSGEGKRLMLAKVFLSDADILILDEPFDHLDTDNSVFVMKNIMQYAKEHGKGLVFISNNKKFATFFEQKYILENGNLYPLKINVPTPPQSGVS